MRKFLRHALFWTSIYLLWAYMKAGGGDYAKFLLINLRNMPFYMAAHYFLRHVQIPRLYDRGKTALFFGSLAASAFLLSGIWVAVTDWWSIPFGAYLIETIQIYVPAVLLLTWDNHFDRVLEQDRIQELEQEKIANELKFLKAQINPHFLFNTLNNLYSCVLNKSPQAPDMILRLSNILDYILYKSRFHRVPLREEVDTIENFLTLEQVRYGERLQIQFQKGDVLTLPVSPLILLSLVENAVKHGASGDIFHPKIKVDIREKSGAIQCQVWNTKSKLKGEITDAHKEGIRLSKVRRQLDLIYPDRYRFLIEDEADTFNVSLTINPSS